jgi:uncharacterized protein YqhQ
MCSCFVILTHCCENGHGGPASEQVYARCASAAVDLGCIAVCMVQFIHGIFSCVPYFLAERMAWPNIYPQWTTTY